MQQQPYFQQGTYVNPNFQQGNYGNQQFVDNNYQYNIQQQNNTQFYQPNNFNPNYGGYPESDQRRNRGGYVQKNTQNYGNYGQNQYSDYIAPPQNYQGIQG